MSPSGTKRAAELWASSSVETPNSTKSHMSASSIPTTRSWEEILPPYCETDDPAAASWSLRCGSYFYPVLATAPTWEFRASDSNRCTKCNEDLRWGFGPLPFKSFHPDRLGCRCHCTALGAPEKAPREDDRWANTTRTAPQARQTDYEPRETSISNERL
jgi:hypothetical protein